MYTICDWLSVTYQMFLTLYLSFLGFRQQTQVQCCYKINNSDDELAQKMKNFTVKTKNTKFLFTWCVGKKNRRLIGTQSFNSSSVSWAHGGLWDWVGTSSTGSSLVSVDVNSAHSWPCTQRRWNLLCFERSRWRRTELWWLQSGQKHINQLHLTLINQQ